jgi:hypothetical protein
VSIVKPQIFNTDDVKAVDSISGAVGSTSVKWSEACELRLDYRLDRLWLLLGPRVILHIPKEVTSTEIEQAREFVRGRRAGRHNRFANSVLDGWVTLIVGDGPSVRLRSFDISDGFDAEFEIARTTGFSGKTR